MIELKGIFQTYAGQHAPVLALRGVDLHIASGEIFGIIGRSGAGKSSLVRCINLLNRPNEGTVRVGLHELTRLKEPELRQARREIGMIFQHFNLLSSRTVYENVAFPLELVGMSATQIRARVEPLLDLVGLTDFKNRYPAQLSGGQKQRIGIARALANHPKVLLSDEATSALDPETTRSILELLKKINRELGLTIVLITHQMQVIKQIADRVAVMEAGQIVECDSVLNVFSRPKEKITRSLIDEVVPQSLPETIKAKAHKITQNNEKAHVLHLVFAGTEGEEPLMSSLVRRFGLDVNLLYGQVDEIQGQSFGSLTLLVVGETSVVQEALIYLRDHGIQAHLEAKNENEEKGKKHV